MAEYDFRGGASVGTDKIEEVIPTLFIGLGGTGKQILTRLRKRLYDKYGSASFPFLRTIAFDTNDQLADGVPTGEDEAEYANVLMKTGQGELYNVEIGSNGYQLARASFNQRNDLRYQQWMHPDFFELVDETSVTQGSGAYRQAGRLAFVSHYRNIQRVIDRELQQIRAYVQDRNRHGDGLPLDVDQRHLDVTIVTSFSGGTGAGMFLDMAYLVKDMLSIDPQVDENRTNRLFDPAGVTSHVTLIAVMPTAFTIADTAKRDRFRLNAYASLLEMEYYNTVRPEDNVFVNEGATRGRNDDAIQFVCNWNGSGEVSIPGRPWNTCYLIDDVNDRNRGAERQTSDVQQMVADYLFLDVGANPFATEKRSLRSNHADLSTNFTFAPVYDPRDGEDGRVVNQQSTLLYENRYGCSCSSFGLGEIYIDPERMRRSASYRLASNLIRQRWLGDVSAQTTNRYNEWSQQDVNSPGPGTGDAALGYRPDDLISAILREEGQDWEESIKRIFDRLSTLNPGNTAPDQLLAKLYSALTTIRSSIDGSLDTEGKAKTVWQTMDDRVRALRGRGGDIGPLRKRLDQRSRSRVNHVGLRPVLRLLEDYTKELEAGRKSALGLAKQPVGSPESIVARLSDSLRVPAPCRRIAVRIEFQKACEAGRRAALHWCRTAAAKLLDGIYADALKFASLTEDKSLGKRYAAWREFLDTSGTNQPSVCMALDALFEQFRKQPGNDRRIPLVPDWDAMRYDHEINTELKDRNPDVGPDAKLVEYFDWNRAEKLILAALGQEWEASDRCGLIERWYEKKQKIANSIPEIANSARLACSGPLGTEFGLAECSNGNVVAELISRDDCNILLQKIVDASSPYLPSIPRERRDRIKVVWKNMLGVTGDDSRTIAEKIQGISLDKSNDLDRDAFSAQNDRYGFEKAKLVFHRELRGIPVHFYGRLDQLHEHYHHTKMKEDRKTCHISYRQGFGDLPDIKLIDDKEYKEISENAIDVYRGLILRFIHCCDDNIFNVLVHDRFMDIEIPLGSRIGRIVKHACCKKQVREFLRDRWAKWKDQVATAAHYAVFYNAIQQNLMQVADVIQKGGAAGVMTPPSRNCLERLLVDAERNLREAENGEAYFDLMRARDRMDREFDAWKASFTSLCKHIRETCLEPANPALPILQMVNDRVKDVKFPIGDAGNRAKGHPDTGPEASSYTSRGAD